MRPHCRKVAGWLEDYSDENTLRRMVVVDLIEILPKELRLVIPIEQWAMRQKVCGMRRNTADRRVVSHFGEEQ